MGRATAGELHEILVAATDDEHAGLLGQPLAYRPADPTHDGEIVAATRDLLRRQAAERREAGRLDRGSHLVEGCLGLIVAGFERPDRGGEFVEPPLLRSQAARESVNLLGQPNERRIRGGRRVRR